MNGWRWLVISPFVLIALAFVLASQPVSQSILTHVPTEKKAVAITFDDGPSPKYTPLILKTLSQYHAHATFFVLGSEAQRYPDLVRAISRQGSAVASHGWQHLNLRRVGASALWLDASKSQDYVRSLGVDPSPFYRPPYGMVSQPMLQIFADHGYTVVLWSIDTRDWSRPGVASIINKVATEVKPGSIILLHDGGGNRSQTATALNAILEQLTQMGYQAVTLPQLVQYRSAPHSARV